MTTDYIAAIRDLAATGTESDALFVRLSDKDCMAVAAAVKADPTLRAAALHPNCSGMVDTFVLSVAMA